MESDSDSHDLCAIVTDQHSCEKEDLVVKIEDLRNCGFHHSSPAFQQEQDTSRSNSNPICFVPRESQIFIRNINDTTISVNIDLNSTINDLKQIIYSCDGIPPIQQRMLQVCREYSNVSRLNELCVTGDSITLLGRLMGGNPEDNPRIMPVTWWLGFARSYQAGRAGEEGRSCYVLSEFKFDDQAPHNWYSDQPLMLWSGVTLIESFEFRFAGICLLFVQGCSLSHLPESISCLASLEQLDISENQLHVLPDSVGQFTFLTTINAFMNQCTSLPESIGRLASLSELNIHQNLLTALPESIGCLSSLMSLDVSRNQLTALPESIGNLASLNQLYAYENQLISLPESIGNLRSLNQLFVSRNQLTILPDSLGNLQYLMCLYISHNSLKSLPACIESLTSLAYLDVSYNNLTSLPASIENMTTLRQFYIYENPILSTDYGRNLVQRLLKRNGIRIGC